MPSFSISHDIRKSISELLMDHWFPGRFEECFHVDENDTHKSGAFGTVYKALCITPPHGCGNIELCHVAVKEIELKYESNYTALTLHSRASRSMSKDSELTHQFLAACQESVLQNWENVNSLQHLNIVRCYASWIESPEETRGEDIVDDLLAVVNSRTSDINRLKNAMKATDVQLYWDEMRGLGMVEILVIAMKTRDWLLLLLGMKFYIVMDYYDYNLMEYMKSDKVNKQDLVDISLDVSEALAYIHESGYVHRDIKPENILVKICDDGCCKTALGDFGLCRKIDDSSHLGRAGTPYYNDYPEAHTGRASDMWAFGITLYKVFAIYRPIRTGRKVALKRYEQLDLVIDKLKTCSEVHMKGVVGKAIGGCKSYRKLKHVITECLHADPLLRLPAEAVCPQLGRSLLVPATI